MAENKFSDTVQALFKGMDSFITTKTVVGDAVKFEDGTIILPLVDVSFGVAAGAFEKNEKQSNSAGGGMGGKISPNSVLVIQNGKCRLVSVKSTDVVTKIVDMVPEVIDKFKKTPEEKQEESDMDKKGEDFIREQNEKTEK